MAPAYDTILEPATLAPTPSTSTSNAPSFPPGPPWGSGPPPWVTRAPPPPPTSTSAPPLSPQTSSTLNPQPAALLATTSRPVASSFPLLPLTTTFNPPGPECNRLTSVTWPTDYLRFATEASCFPPGYTAGPEGLFFSPGIACPSGYRTACQDARGVASVTTVTCCPTLENMPLMDCYEGSGASDTMPGFQCHASIPATGLALSLVGPNLDTLETYTTLQTVASAQAIYAYGVKMVYQATDLTASPTSSTSNSIAPPSPLSEVVTGSALSTGIVVALGVTIPLVLLGASTAAFLVWRHKKRQRNSMAMTDATWERSHELPTKSEECMSPSSVSEIMSEDTMRVEMPGDRRPVELAE